jgi:hypothetical protein
LKVFFSEVDLFPYNHNSLFPKTIGAGVACPHEVNEHVINHAVILVCRYFDYTPPGLIQNRFVGDTASMDVMISGEVKLLE